jgi:hypothetical protein
MASKGQRLLESNLSLSYRPNESLLHPSKILPCLAHFNRSSMRYIRQRRLLIRAFVEETPSQQGRALKSSPILSSSRQNLKAPNAEEHRKRMHAGLFHTRPNIPTSTTETTV